VSHRNIRRWANGASALIFAAAVAATAVNRHIPKTHPGVLLELEFAPTAQDVRDVTSPADLRAAIMRAQRADSVLLIPAYWALFAVSGMVLMLSGGPVNRFCGFAAMLTITIAAAVDLRENAVIEAALTSTAQAAGPARWATAKWLLLFASAGALGVPLLTRARRLRFHANLTAALFAIAALHGVLATLVRPIALPSAVFALAAALFCLALLFLWDPEYFSPPT
jgi:hypothetical protein